MNAEYEEDNCMSGPKISAAELARREQERLERERKERLRKIKEATKEFFKVQNQIEHNLEERKRSFYSLKLNAEKFKELDHICNDTEEQLLEVIRLIKTNSNKPLKNGADEISTQTNELQKYSDIVFAKYNKEFSKFKSRIMSRLEQEKATNSFSDFSKNLNTEKSDIIGKVDFCFKVLEQQPIKDNLKEELGEYLNKIKGIINNPFLNANDKSYLMKFIESIINSEKSNIESLVTQCKYGLTNIFTKLQTMEDLYCQYVALQVECNNCSKVKIKFKEKYKFVTVKILEEEIILLENELKELEEKNYMEAQLHEVMSLFGYNMCENITLGTQKNNEHYLCSNEIDDVAVHVHISKDRQFMMEIVGTEESLNKEKALKITKPSDTNTNIKLYNKQGEFCNMHPKIVKELEKRGVILNAVSYREPDNKYNKVLTSSNNKKLEINSSTKAEILKEMNYKG